MRNEGKSGTRSGGNRGCPIPEFVFATEHFEAHGRFVFFDSDGARFFVAAQADPKSGLLYDAAVVSFTIP